jgi:hypothetical protein
MDFATTLRDQCFVALDHGGNLLALIRVHNKNDFIMAHKISFWVRHLRENYVNFTIRTG